jgi:hypothetical protein
MGIGSLQLGSYTRVGGGNLMLGLVLADHSARHTLRQSAETGTATKVHKTNRCVGAPCMCVDVCGGDEVIKLERSICRAKQLGTRIMSSSANARLAPHLSETLPAFVSHPSSTPSLQVERRHSTENPLEHMSYFIL